MFVNAGDINCQGAVRFTMDYPGKCNGNIVFMTEGANGSNGKWICPPSEKGNPLVLAALASGKEVQPYIDDQGGSITCSNMPNYVQAKYLVLVK